MIGSTSLFEVIGSVLRSLVGSRLLVESIESTKGLPEVFLLIWLIIVKLNEILYKTTS